MSYYLSQEVNGKSFDEVIELVTAELKTEGFGVLTEIDISNTFKNKLDVDFKKYKILGACNPKLAHKALSTEDKVGVFLPCNVVVEENDSGTIEVSAVDPVASMLAVENEALRVIISEVKQKLERVISKVK
jgi:uncharacterized protein (DUF302 family)